MLLTLKIRSEDNRCDIEVYATAWSKKIQEKFGLQDDKRDEIAVRIVTASGGKTFSRGRLLSQSFTKPLTSTNLKACSY